LNNSQLTKITEKTMSTEKLQAFAEAVSKSEELQKQLTSIQVESARSTAENIAKLSETAGTTFTAEEYLQAIAEASEEMPPEQLHSVAGGVWDPSATNIIGSLLSAGLFCAAAAITSAIASGSADECQISVGPRR
jgi:predicted ribosomally synthesized peptide with nif11-like leader